MLAKRIIPCLDVKDGKIVKGTRFKNHQIIGDILDYANYYRDTGADELVFYDITASSDGRVVDRQWITRVASLLDIPFSVAGGIRTVDEARSILNAGADKISINSPALENPSLINELAREFGSQCVVVGIDSQDNHVYQYTGDTSKMRTTFRRVEEWAAEVQDRGAGEIVLNCMNQDGIKQGYDINQLKNLKQCIQIPLVASGGAGTLSHFKEVFTQANVDAALAASVFHNKSVKINDLKQYLKTKNIEVKT